MDPSAIPARKTEGAADIAIVGCKGLKIVGGGTEEWTLPGWTGSRGDMLRALMAIVKETYREWVAVEFECRVNAVDVQAGTLTYASTSGVAAPKQFDFIIGGDGAG